jgi:uracil-DNA glycosylase
MRSGPYVRDKSAVPRRSYRSLASLQRDCRACRACAEAGFPLASGPVFEGRRGQRALLIGQSPGAVEGAEGRPWRGRAGQTLRRWLDLDEDAFYATFYCTSITRCYPGKSPSGRGDRLPAPREVELCRFWLDRELQLLRPALVVTVGGLAARQVLGLARLTEHVGERLELGGAVAIPLPHPSGASGWLNLPENRRRVARAAALVRRELVSARLPGAGETSNPPTAVSAPGNGARRGSRS